jgi:hypothetical protein
LFYELFFQTYFYLHLFLCLGHTYFFKDNKFWRFDNRRMKVSENYPQSISEFWFESFLCKKTIDQKNSSKTSAINSINSSAFHKFNFNINLILMNALLFYNFYILNVLYNRLDIQ